MSQPTTMTQRELRQMNKWRQKHRRDQGHVVQKRWANRRWTDPDNWKYYQFVRTKYQGDLAPLEIYSTSGSTAQS